MCKEYPIILNREAIGVAKVRKLGLYYEICCRCTFYGEGYPHIVVHYNNTDLDLGTCLKSGGFHTVTTKLPVKKLPEGEWAFELIQPGVEKGRFYPIRMGQPFDHLEKLSKSKLAVHGDSVGIIYPE